MRTENNRPETPQPAGTGGTSWLVKVLKPFAFIAFLLKVPADWLREHVYESTAGTLWRGLGLVATLIAGIYTCYSLHWTHDVGLVKSVLAGMLSAAVTYWYAWPATVWVAFRKMADLSKWLWSHIDTEAGRRRRYYGGETADERRRPTWFSWVLYIIVGAATVFLAVYGGWNTLIWVHGWLDWGDFGYLVGAVVGFMAGMALGSIGMSILSNGRVYYVAGVTGVAAVFFGRALTHAYLPSTVLGMNITPFEYMAEFALWFGYVFPIAHILISNGFKWLGDLVERFFDSVYGEADGGYKEFFAQVANLVVTYFVVTLCLHFAPQFLHISGWVLYAAVAAVGTLSYLVVGRVLNEVGAFGSAVLSGLWLAFKTFVLYTAAAFVGGWVGGLVVAAVALALYFCVVFPLLYIGVRKVADPLLSSWARKPLVTLHKVLSEELFHAYDNTYEDTTDYKPMFSQLVNAFASVGVFAGGVMLGNALEFAPIFSYLIAVVLTLVAYLLLGKFLRAHSNIPLGWTAGVAAGIGLGAHVLSTTNNFWAAVPAGFGAMVGTYLVGFTVSYVALRAVLNLLKAQAWLKPVVVGLFEGYEQACSNIWTQFKNAYAQVEASMRPIFADLKRSWEQAFAQLRRTPRNGETPRENPGETPDAEDGHNNDRNDNNRQ